MELCGMWILRESSQDEQAHKDDSYTILLAIGLPARGVWDTRTARSVCTARSVWNTRTARIARLGRVGRIGEIGRIRIRRFLFCYFSDSFCN